MQDGVTILGASGFIGTRLVRRLAQPSPAARRIIAVDREPPRERLDGVDYVQADVREPLGAEMAFPGGTLFNLAAVHRTPGHPPHEYYETNVKGALNACALAERAGVDRILFTSSISVYGPSEETLDERSPLRPVSDYGRSKALAEDLHRRWRAAGPGRRLVVVRPAVVFGPGERGNYTKLARALKRGYFLYPGRRDTVKSGGYVDELLNTFDFALDRPDAEILYNFAFPAMSSTQDIVAAFSEVEGKAFRPATLPLAPVLLGARLAHALTRTSTFHPDRVMKLVKSTRVAPGWLTAQGYPFAFDLRRALQAWSRETHGAFD